MRLLETNTSTLMGMRDFGVAISNYKCFGPNPQGMFGIYPVNLLVGRNNSGKSTIIDLIGAFCSENGPDQVIKKLPEVRAETDPQSWILSLPGESALSILRGIPWDAYLRMRMVEKISVKHWWQDRWLMAEFGKPGTVRPVDVPDDLLPRTQVIAKKFSLAGANLLHSKKFLRLRSDRDMVPEQHDDNLEVKGNGAGATNMVQHFINQGLRREIVKEIILDALNDIFGSDSNFREILVQKRGNSWEVFLREEGKGFVALSQSGSGLRTVLLVLIFLYLVPYGNDLRDFVFAFEELENNLHPALQRRLFSFIRDFAVENECHVILSTHSLIAIDLFSGDGEAQIIHVTHDGQWAKAR